MRKGNSQPAKHSYGCQALIESRSGLSVDLLITDATLGENQAARQLLTRAWRRKGHPKTPAADMIASWHPCMFFMLRFI